MRNEHFIPAQPGYRAWDVFEEDGKTFATFSGEVVAWRIAAAADALEDESRFVGEPILIGPMEAAVVERDGVLLHATCSWPSFESWLHETGAKVCALDAQRARDWYGVSEKYIEA